MIPKEGDVEMNCLNGNFLCGVVEGFYGRPWTTKQRKKLFQRMKSMGMNTYLYAPKDDCKHRMYWRDQYSVEEADHLTALISDATENDVVFVYAISPGLDINYSNTKEVNFLKKKLEQVASFGCKAFALLFDDIDVDMCEADKEVFQSIAHAQVSVTNEVYQHLEQPTTFLFCPTEYCASRAIPSVPQSEYLNTLGSKLLPGIDIMWTGPKVISKDITLESVQEVSKVLQRPPVIWDNIHANDYDQKRLFLGPYEGRSPELIPYLHGVLTNPNCEFEANFVAMHTLAQWSKSNMEAVKKDVILCSSPVSSDIKLETQGDGSSDTVPYQSYQPKQALCAALRDWLLEFSSDCDAVKTKVAKAPAPVNTPPVLPPPESSPSAPAIPMAVAASLGVANVNELNALDSFMQPETIAVVNSLVDPPTSDSETESVDGATEPMDCAISPGSSPVSTSLESVPAPLLELDKDKSEIVDAEMADLEGKTGSLTYEELSLLVDMFYMPFEHGSRGVEMLHNFNWLKMSSCSVTEAKCRTATEEQQEAASDWFRRAEKFHQDVAIFQNVIDHVCDSPNRAILYDLYPYMWDMKVSLDILCSYLRWLGVNKSYEEAFSSGQHESWVFRGGLQTEFQRLVPLEMVLDLAIPAVPAVPVAHTHTIRPYTAADESAVYEVCRRTCDDGADGTEIFPFHRDLVAEKLIGAFVTNSPEYAFVMEDAGGVCGYVLGALDAHVHNRQLEMAWIPAMQEKYPKPDKTAELTPAEEMISSFHTHKSYRCDVIQKPYPSLVRVDMLPERCNDGIARHALACAVAALKTNGSHGIYAEIHVGDRNTVERYAALGMKEAPTVNVPEDLVIVARSV